MSKAAKKVITKLVKALEKASKLLNVEPKDNYRPGDKYYFLYSAITTGKKYLDVNIINKRNRSLERLERISWYIALRYYDMETNFGKIFNNARKQADIAIMEICEPDKKFNLPEPDAYWRWRKDEEDKKMGYQDQG